METNKYPIVVEAFHYDRIDPKTTNNADVQVAMKRVSFEDEKLKAEEKKGAVFEVKVLFNVDQAPFKAQAVISRIVQIYDYFDDPQKLPNDDVQKLSRPLVEYFETLVYQVTAVALDHGISLDFQPGVIEPNTPADDKPTE